MHQTFEKSSLAMTHKLDDMIELPNSLLKKTNKEDLEYEMVRVNIPRFMSWLGSTNAYDEHISSLDVLKAKILIRETTYVENTMTERETLDSYIYLRCPPEQAMQILKWL
ncbi:hypothetical protein Tco_0769394 [Tanacetum coccineum]|uniref:Uncharacterized protein n=1 Tax=Tanacetum coccineum TaxID=301880 RepID=A0ABQ4Z9B9_9ASTR